MIATLQSPGLVSDAVSPPRKPRTLQRLVRDDQICILSFNRPNSTANVLDQATLGELEEELAFIAGSPQLKGLVLASAKGAIFLAGAQLQMFRGSVPLSQVREYIEQGQNLMERLASLPIPTVAAIHGAVRGGGCEICLACDYRLATPDRTTTIGMPETQLGLLPAWGGSTRLPRLIGLPKAMEIVPAGKTLGMEQALAMGLVDELVPAEELIDAAVRRIRQGKPHRRKRWLVNNPLVAPVLAMQARRRLLKKARGHYPAMLKALEVVAASVSHSTPESLAREREAILELVQTEACHNLVEGFFLRERAKKRTVPGIAASAEPKAITRTAVIGAGVMGAGIAQWLSARQLPVILRDIAAERVSQGLARIEKIYEDAVKRQILTAREAREGLDRIFPAIEDVPLHDTDLIIEAATENLEVKKKIFRRLDELAGEDTILATNTSALPLSELAAGTRRPGRVLGLHFMNPVHRMELMEIVQAPQTSPEVLQRALRFTQQIGKLPVIVKDSPGFVVNRILMPYLMEVGHLYEAGAWPEDLDEAMLEFGMPMGPLRLLDEIGIDVVLSISRTLAASFSYLKVPEVFRKMVQAGLLGRKGGGGFYHYREGGKSKPNPQVEGFVCDQTSSALSRPELQERMVLPMVNEAARCIEEGIVSEPADVDFAMVMGTGFAPFRGGPLRYADNIGLAHIVEATDRCFSACALLRSTARNGRNFYSMS